MTYLSKNTLLLSDEFLEDFDRDKRQGDDGRSENYSEKSKSVYPAQDAKKNQDGMQAGVIADYFRGDEIVIHKICRDTPDC